MRGGAERSVLSSGPPSNDNVICDADPTCQTGHAGANAYSDPMIRTLGEMLRVIQSFPVGVNDHQTDEVLNAAGATAAAHALLTANVPPTKSAYSTTAS
jgi:hypothetical protein